MMRKFAFLILFKYHHKKERKWYFYSNGNVKVGEETLDYGDLINIL